ncbi:thioredoxin family protein [Persicitalea jodogahamensis]|uniref:Thioredoxin family protein n=1 Tax=Persicitalea jodogahamensis TaxID=402147 RepID=A0A8J3D4D7_9BACT|nr:thioredoxin family protein [Persicitalea jodogahamensis]GHB52960.1 thioredoxin family protein [Persicitalea jodogahamensis]
MKRYLASIYGTLLLGMVVSLQLPATGFPNQKIDPVQADYKIGDVVADFQLRSVDGRSVSLRDFDNQKGVIVIFTCNHCPFSKAYEDRIGALNGKFAGQGYPVIAINPSDPKSYEDDNFEKLKEHVSAKGHAYPYLVDDSQTVARAFGANRTPQAYVLQNNGGKFTVRYIGTLDDNPQDPGSVRKHYVDDAVSNLLAGRPVTTTTTRAIGCAIKWKDA